MRNNMASPAAPGGGKGKVNMSRSTHLCSELIHCAFRRAFSLAALVALALVTGAGSLGTSLSDFFGAVGTKIGTYAPK